MSIDALLFDKDGTLFDFDATWTSFARAFLMQIADGDIVHATHLGEQIGFDLKAGSYTQDAVIIAGTVDDVAAALHPHLPDITHTNLIRSMNQEAAKAPQVAAVPLAPFLDGLRAAGKKLGVATNDGEMPALAHLQSAGIRDRFDFVAGYDSGHGAKPGPGPLLAFAEQVGIPAGNIAMVGDSRHDLQAGRAAGMVTVAVLTGIARADELQDLADVVLPDIGHIPDWLDTL